MVTAGRRCKVFSTKKGTVKKIRWKQDIHNNIYKWRKVTQLEGRPENSLYTFSPNWSEWAQTWLNKRPGSTVVLLFSDRELGCKILCISVISQKWTMHNIIFLQCSEVVSFLKHYMYNDLSNRERKLCFLSGCTGENTTIHWNFGNIAPLCW
jgi:hypothetical protein